MTIRFNKAFKDNIKKLIKKGNFTLAYDIESTFKVVQKDFVDEGNLLVRVNQDKVYNTIIVLSKHYEIVN